MIAAVVILAGAVAVLAAMACVLVLLHQRERDNWSAERRALVDRAIARHSGEIIAFDRQAGRAAADPKPAVEPVLVEGLT